MFWRCECMLGEDQAAPFTPMIFSRAGMSAPIRVMWAFNINSVPRWPSQAIMPLWSIVNSAIRGRRNVCKSTGPKGTWMAPKRTTCSSLVLTSGGRWRFWRMRGQVENALRLWNIDMPSVENRNARSVSWLNNPLSLRSAKSSPDQKSEDWAVRLKLDWTLYGYLE